MAEIVSPETASAVTTNVIWQQDVPPPEQEIHKPDPLAMDEATEAIAEPGPPTMHVEPIEAAKRIRSVARDIWAGMQAYTPGGVMPGANANLENARAFIASASTYARRTAESGERAHKQMILARESLVRAQALTKGLKISAELSELRHRLDYAIEYTDSVNLNAPRTRETITNVAKKLNAMGADPVTADINLAPLIAKADELHKLAQQIPTFQGGPQTPAENVLRAVAVVLKNSGY